MSMVMRKGEILNLSWDKVDFGNCVITVEHTKNGEYRTIPMNQQLFETLKMVDKHSDFVFHKDDGTCPRSSVGRARHS